MTSDGIVVFVGICGSEAENVRLPRYFNEVGASWLESQRRAGVEEPTKFRELLGQTRPLR
jgi:hypothetical protein